MLRLHGAQNIAAACRRYAARPALALAAVGIRSVETSGLDTYAEPARFYSYRRATHGGEPAYGRQISLIGLPV